MHIVHRISSLGMLLLVAASTACDEEEVPMNPPAMIAVTTGEAHSCALSETGAAYCWGAGDLGQLGSGTTTSTRYATRVSGSNRFTSIDAGAFHTCALTANGTAYCWGANEFGQLGAGNVQGALAPQSVNTTERFTSLSAGESHTCAITNDGRAFCWGYGIDGQLGGGTLVTSVPIPAAVTTTQRFTQISAGSRHTCAVATTGTAFCWGANDVSQLGNGPESGPRPTPGPVADNWVFTNVSAGWNHACGVTVDLLGFCWGENRAGEHGNGTVYEPGLAASFRPAQVETYGTILYSKISAGRSFSCGVRLQSELYCWGSGVHGQLGNGNNVDASQPQLVLPFPGRVPFTYTALDVSNGTHACGISIARVVYCWGHGTRGQLGNGEWLTMIALPVLIAGP